MNIELDEEDLMRSQDFRKIFKKGINYHMKDLKKTEDLMKITKRTNKNLKIMYVVE